jgi:urease accessory protein
MDFRAQNDLFDYQSMEAYQMKKSVNFGILNLGGVLFTLFSGNAFAHHLMEGRVPSTLFEGFASGLAHPVIGLDHLAFVIAVGLLSAVMTNRRWLTPSVFVGATVLGVAVHMLSVNLPVVEELVALSVVAGGILLMSRNYNISAVLGLAGIAGLFHGYAYGEAIIGAETGPLFAYLIGFAAVQWGICMLAAFVGSKVLLEPATAGRKWQPAPTLAAGAVIALAGILALTGNLPELLSVTAG